MKIPIFQIDAFTSQVFGGNPAAICPLDTWPDDATMQAIAAENNVSETAFFMEAGDYYDLRWFTPLAEVDLCGHATLATAHLLFSELEIGGQVVHFETRSGRLSVSRDGDSLVMNFPSQPPEPCNVPDDLVPALGVEPVEILADADYFVVLASEDEVRAAAPDIVRLRGLDRRGVIITAAGSEVDFVSRFFAPKLGIDEDPVTGSAHCELTPYWSKHLGKTVMTAHQVSARGGELFCEDQGERVLISGRAVKYMEGLIEI
ncbi:MAG: PhzF family phenazine biosynthesis protein [Pseudomonadota bacterium]|nr:PhzF family phenazine biosynthesis protein [Pseudomonadota bacterium]